ncbi:hypothetical protein OUZ56_031116 [Daphnia magna]|uniref:Uncharacterized protein n=1 Tax=Daphnia magna TaxID=35525 RepID=A0ABQ9ZTA8_9CRUS|nr:hypothetical protein OUZ56_031116 [Daphnia magna]
MKDVLLTDLCFLGAPLVIATAAAGVPYVAVNPTSFVFDSRDASTTFAIEIPKNWMAFVRGVGFKPVKR